MSKETCILKNLFPSINIVCGICEHRLDIIAIDDTESKANNFEVPSKDYLVYWCCEKCHLNMPRPLSVSKEAIKISQIDIANHIEFLLKRNHEEYVNLRNK